MIIPWISCYHWAIVNFICLYFDHYLMNSSETENTNNPIQKPTLPVISLSASSMLQEILMAVAHMPGCLMETFVLAAKLFFKLLHCERPRHLFSMINTIACNNHALQIPICQKNHVVSSPISVWNRRLVALLLVFQLILVTAPNMWDTIPKFF